MIPDGSEAGARLGSRVRVKKIPFAGSLPTHAKSKLAATRSNLKHVTLDLEGGLASAVLRKTSLQECPALSSQNAPVDSEQICLMTTRVPVDRESPARRSGAF